MTPREKFQTLLKKQFQFDIARQLAEATAKIRENYGNDALDAESNLLKGQDLQLGKD